MDALFNLLDLVIVRGGSIRLDDECTGAQTNRRQAHFPRSHLAVSTDQSAILKGGIRRAGTLLSDLAYFLCPALAALLKARHIFIIGHRGFGATIISATQWAPTWARLELIFA
ncbi:MAG: hypothetical protein ACR2KT_07845 [Methylocella sp.]